MTSKSGLSFITREIQATSSEFSWQDLSSCRNTPSEKSDISHMSNPQLTPITPEGEKPVLSARCLLLSFQFKELKNKHYERYRRHITPFLRSAVTSITTNYPPPTLRRGRSASVATNASSISLLTDPAESEINVPLPWTRGDSGKAALPKAVVDYRREVGDYLASPFFVHWFEVNESNLTPPNTPVNESTLTHSPELPAQRPGSSQSAEEWNRPLTDKSQSAERAIHPSESAQSSDKATQRPSSSHSEGDLVLPSTELVPRPLPGLTRPATSPNFSKYREPSTSTTTSPSTGRTPEGRRQRPFSGMSLNLNPAGAGLHPGANAGEGSSNNASNAGNSSKTASGAAGKGTATGPQRDPIDQTSRSQRDSTDQTSRPQRDPLEGSRFSRNLNQGAGVFGQPDTRDSIDQTSGPQRDPLEGSRFSRNLNPGSGIFGQPDPLFGTTRNVHPNTGVVSQEMKDAIAEAVRQATANQNPNPPPFGQPAMNHNAPPNIGPINREIRQAIAEAVREAIAGAGIQAQNATPNTAMNSVNPSNGSGFRASDLGFFWPDLEESYGTGDIVFASKETLYRDVYTWCRRAEDYAAVKGVELVRKNLPQCFRGSALSWWLNTLSEDERAALIMLETGFKRLMARLQEKFKLTVSSALVQLNHQNYSMTDAHKRREPAQYMQTVSKFALQAGIIDEHAQCTWAWNNLDLELQKTVPPPRPGMSIREFTDELETRKEMFHRAAESKNEISHAREQSRRQDRDNTKEATNKGQYNSFASRRYGGSAPPVVAGRPYNSVVQPFPYPSYATPVPQWPAYPYNQRSTIGYNQLPQHPQNARQGQQGQQGQQEPSDKQQGKKELPAPRQPLMITAGNAQPNQRPFNQRGSGFGRGGYDNRRPPFMG